jgi:hypothetical protein
VIGFGSWFAYNGFTSVESYPTLDNSGVAFQGKSVETQFGYLEFDDDDVSTVTDGNFISSPKGIQTYSLNEDTTVDEIIDNIQPREGLKVLFAFYSPGEEELGLEKGFYTYPVGPFLSNEIKDPTTFEVPAQRGFMILSNEDYKFNEDVIMGSSKSARSFKVKLKDNESGWVLFPLSGPGNLNHPRIEIAYLMNDDGEYEEVMDFRDVELGKNAFAWVKLRKKQAGDDEVAEEESLDEELNEAAETEVEEAAVEETEDSAGVSTGTFQRAEEPVAAVTENLVTAISPENMSAIRFAEVATTDDAAVSIGDAYVKSVKYLSNIETSDALINTPSASFPERYEGDFIAVDSISDDRSTPYIMGAVEIEVGGTQGTVDINSIEYSTHSQRKNKIGLKWFSWKDTKTDYCIGSTPMMHIVQYNDGIFSDLLLFEDQNDNKIFSSSSEADNANLTKLTAGNKYVLVLSMKGIDHCAKKFNAEAPLQVKAHVRTDFVNIEFIVPGESSPVNWNGDPSSGGLESTRIEGFGETRWVNLIDKTPYR